MTTARLHFLLFLCLVVGLGLLSHDVDAQTLSIFGIPNVCFVGKISMGTPSNIYYVAIDTGSRVSWLPSTACTSDMCQTRSLYNASASKTYTDTGIVYKMSEGDKSVSGTYTIDSLTIGGLQISQNFVLVDKQASGKDKLRNYDGVIGLAYSSAYFNPVEAAFAQKKISNQLFALWLQRNKDKDDGEITIGKLNPNRYTGSIAYTNVTGSSGYWQFKLGKISVTVGKKTVSVCDKGCDAIINTGLTFSYAPASHIKTLNNALGGKNTSGLWYFDCSKMKKYSNLVLTVAGKTFQMTSYDYLIKYNQLCLSPLQPSTGSQKNYWLLGLDFLRTFYTVFDTKNKRIGFANPVNS